MCGHFLPEGSWCTERMLVAMAVGIEEGPREKHRCSFISYVLGTLSGQTLGWVLGTQW